MNPTFSIVIPTHNRERSVIRAIESVLATDSETVEVIVVDDASTDRTCNAVQERYSGDIRVTLFRLSENSGPSVARNLGLEFARGKFVLFLDSDDLLTPSALQIAQRVFDALPVLKFVTVEGEEFATGQQAPIGEAARKHVVRSQCPGWREQGFAATDFSDHVLADVSGRTPGLSVLASDCSQAILYGDLFFLSGLFIRREAAIAAGPFNARFRYLEDWDFAARLCLTGIGGYVEATGFHREVERTDQLSRVERPWRRALMHFKVLASVSKQCRDSAWPLPPKLRHAEAAADYWFARCSSERSHPRIGRPFFLRAMRTGYKPLKCMIWLVYGIFRVNPAKASTAVAS